jgi:hypothetical protein
VLSKELGYLSGVPGRLSNGFVTFLLSVRRPEDVEANHVILGAREVQGPAVAHFRHLVFTAAMFGGAALRSVFTAFKATRLFQTRLFKEPST